jgi:hypothetical protein
MALPRWLAQINKRVFNPIEIRRGKRPVLIHVGRTSGKTRHTPLDAHRLPDGYLFIPMYGAAHRLGEERTLCRNRQTPHRWSRDRPRVPPARVQGCRLATGAAHHQSAAGDHGGVPAVAHGSRSLSG